MNIFAVCKNLNSSRYLIHRSQSCFIKHRLAGKHFDTVVDVGVGRAPNKKYVSHTKYIGIDIEDRGGVPDVILADVNRNIPLGDASTDLVIMTEVLEHLKTPGTAINETHRILKSGGMLLLTTPLTWPVHEPPNDFYRFTKYGLQYLLEEAGFKHIEIKADKSYFAAVAQLVVLPMRKTWQKPLVWCINLMSLIFGPLSKNFDLPIDYHVIAIKS